MQTIETFYIHTTLGEVETENAKENWQCLVCMQSGETKKSIKHSDNCSLVVVGKVMKSIYRSDFTHENKDYHLECNYCYHECYSGVVSEMLHENNCPIMLIQQFEEFL